MKDNRFTDHSLSDVHSSIDTTRHKTGWKKIFSFIGPAYLVSVGYMDPGNWATDLAAGSKYGYTLIWVLLASNIMAVVLQSLSARLGIVRGRDLAQANRESFPPTVNFILWILAEIAIAATDLAEVLGMAIGIQLLFGLPLIFGVSITVLDTFLLLYLQRLGMRKIEAFIIALIGIIGVCFLINIILAQPSLHLVLKGFIPSLPDAATLYKNDGIKGIIPHETALYLAIGIIGATVMPHNLYLHSAIIQTRKINKTNAGIKEALKWSFIDSTIALNLAFFINAAILILAATVFYQTGKTEVGEISKAHELLSPLLGSSIASTLFAVALIAAGQSSTITGTMSGQIVMEGYLKLRINPLMRRLITRLVAIVPAIIFILISGEDDIDSLLILSQVVLSVQLGFAIIPLIHFVSDKKTMNTFAIKWPLQIISWLIAAVLVGLNGKMIGEEMVSFLNGSSSIFYKIILILFCLFFVLLLLYVTIHPWIRKKTEANSIRIHPEFEDLPIMKPPVYKKIAVALEFSHNDAKLIETALGLAQKDSIFVFIHIVETATAKLHGHLTADYETEKDRERMEALVLQMNNLGYDVEGKLGFTETTKEIIRLVQVNECDLLVIGAHGHSGLKDFIYGTTIDTVRHLIKIPVFIVQLKD
jgi:manganese transport protein